MNQQIDKDVIISFLKTIIDPYNEGYLEIFDNYARSRYFDNISPKVIKYIQSIVSKNHEVHFGAALRKESLNRVSTNENIISHPSYFLDIDTDTREDKLYDEKIRKNLERKHGINYTDMEIKKATEKASRRAKEILDRFLQILPKDYHPTYIINSGHGYQVWWALKEPETDLILWRRVQSTLVKLANADISVKDHRRIMRIPGTVNFKNPNAPTPVQIIHSNPDKRYMTEDFITLFDTIGCQLSEDETAVVLDEKPESSAPIHTDTRLFEEITSQLPKRTRAMLEDGERHPRPSDTDLTRSARDWSIFLSMVRAKISDDNIVTIFKNSICAKEKQASSYEGEKYIRRKIKQAKKQLQNKKPKRKTDKNNKPIFDPLTECKIFMFNRHIIFQHEQLKEYRSGYYHKLPDRCYLGSITNQLSLFNHRQSKAKEILETLKNELTDPKIDDKVNPNPYLLTLKNGVLDIRDMSLANHDPNFLSTIKINANYDPEATCPNFRKFIDSILIDDNGKPDKELIKVVQEFFGYCLFPKIKYHKALILYGEGSNGKSVLISVLEELLKNHVSNVHYESIGSDLFATSDMAGSLLNISSELSAKACLNDSIMKQIIAGDTIRAQRKHKPAFDFKPFAKHIITVNTLPRSHDSSLGFFRRFLIIPFKRTFLPKSDYQNVPPESRQGYGIEVPNLEETLFEELDGILLWAIDGLKRLLRNDTFTSSEQITSLNRVFRLRSSSVEYFLEDVVDTTDVTSSTSLQRLYKRYIDYCKDYGIPSITNRKFAAELRNHGLMVERGTGNKTIVRGCNLKEEEDE